MTRSNLHDASLAYAAFVGGLSAIAVASAIARRSSHKYTAGRVGTRSRCGVQLVELTPFTDHASMP